MPDQTVSRMKHSALIEAGPSYTYPNGASYASFQASCLCGWREEHVYHRRERAERAFYRHIAEVQG